MKRRKPPTPPPSLLTDKEIEQIKRKAHRENTLPPKRSKQRRAYLKKYPSTGVDQTKIVNYDLLNNAQRTRTTTGKGTDTMPLYEMRMIRGKLAPVFINTFTEKVPETRQITEFHRLRLEHLREPEDRIAEIAKTVGTNGIDVFHYIKYGAYKLFFCGNEFFWYEEVNGMAFISCFYNGKDRAMAALKNILWQDSFPLR